MKYQALAQILEAVGKPIKEWESPDGSRALVLPYGGRILGLFTPDNDENLFWTHAALREIDSARRFYQDEQWHNSGGERTWIAPEVDFFFPDYPNLNRYWQQRELDPGSYQVLNDNGNLTLRTFATVTLSRTKQTVRLEISKALSPAPNPFRHEHSEHFAQLTFAGYNLRTSLRIVGSEQPDYIGLWHLTQMPHGGEMLVSKYFRSEPKTYMGKIEGGDLTVSDHLIRYRMRSAGEHKLGVRAIALTGRAGYLQCSEGQASLVVKNFNVNPSGQYVDVPWLEPNDFGYSFQACNVNSHLGAFSELEYHVPAIGAKTGELLSEDQSQLWAFRGSEAAIRSAGRYLISAQM